MWYRQSGMGISKLVWQYGPLWVYISMGQGGDEQLDRPNSQTRMEWYRVCVAYFVWIRHKHNSLPLGPIQPSSPSTKELHGHSYCVELAKDKAWTNLTPCWAIVSCGTVGKAIATVIKVTAFESILCQFLNKNGGVEWPIKRLQPQDKALLAIRELCPIV